MLVVPALRLGPMRFTAFGLCAAIGLVLAMALARLCARRVDLDPERVWDAGLFAIVSCFVASRLLLVAFDLKAFLHYPLLVLSLPSLTYIGMTIAAVMVWVYLRRRRLSVLRMLDVFAAPAAVLAAWLEVGHWLDGSEVGMPTALPWGVREPWSGAALHMHPVAAYGVVAAGVTAFVLWRALVRRPERLGRVAGLGLVLGGAAAFGLDMLTQPVPAIVDLLIEPGQWVALVVMLAGAVVWVFAPMRSVMPVANGVVARADAEVRDGLASEVEVIPDASLGYERPLEDMKTELR